MANNGNIKTNKLLEIVTSGTNLSLQLLDQSWNTTVRSNITNP